MKPIQPHPPAADKGPGYPSLSEAKTGRRGFLQQTLGWAAGAGTVWLLDRVSDPTARARPRPRPQPRLKAKNGWYQATLELPPYLQVPNTSYWVCRVVVQTRSRKLARFLISKAELKPLRKVVLPFVKKLTARDITNRKRLARLRTRLAKTLVKHYQKRTRRRVAAPESA